jgi:hypothetical protein
MKRSVRTAAACLSCLIALPVLVAGQTAETVVNDPARGLTIAYTQEPGFVIFTAVLPASGTVGVLVDGDQDGKWGNGPEDRTVTSRPINDVAFERDKDDHALCGQYVWSADPSDPAATYSSSGCGVFRSKATVEVSAPDASGRIIMRYRIPVAELFGREDTAHVAFRFWDGARSHFYFSPVAPLVVHNASLSR